MHTRISQKIEGNKSLARPKYRWDNNIKMGHKKVVKISNFFEYVRLEVLTAVRVIITFWVLTPCISVGRNLCFSEMLVTTRYSKIKTVRCIHYTFLTKKTRNPYMYQNVYFGLLYTGAYCTKYITYSQWKGKTLVLTSNASI
jgi:hypothetical protein